MLATGCVLGRVWRVCSRLLPRALQSRHHRPGSVKKGAEAREGRGRASTPSAGTRGAGDLNHADRTPRASRWFGLV